MYPIIIDSTCNVGLSIDIVGWGTQLLPVDSRLNSLLLPVFPPPSSSSNDDTIHIIRLRGRHGNIAKERINTAYELQGTVVKEVEYCVQVVGTSPEFILIAP